MTYERVRAAHLNAVQAAMEDHIARLDWQRERIDRYRDQRLRALLVVRERTVAVSRPATGRPRYRRCHRRGLGRGADHEKGRRTGMLGRHRHRLRSSAANARNAYWHNRNGIPTLPTTIKCSARAARAGCAASTSGVGSSTCPPHAWHGGSRRERSGASQPGATRLAVLEAGAPPHASTPLFDVPTAAGMATVVIEAGAPFDEVLTAVAAADPRPSSATRPSSDDLRARRLPASWTAVPVRVSTNSEPLLDEDRRAIADAWRAPVHNLWGSTEIGVQAVGCALGEGLHICEDEVVLERVDENGVPVAPDEPAARTLATGLANCTFPFIRYDLGDEVTLLPGPCECGSSFARVADIGGRRDDGSSATAQSRSPPSLFAMYSAPIHTSPNTKSRRHPRAPTFSRSATPMSTRLRLRWLPHCAAAACRIRPWTSGTSTAFLAIRRAGN